VVKSSGRSGLESARTTGAENVDNAGDGRERECEVAEDGCFGVFRYFDLFVRRTTEERVVESEGEGRGAMWGAR
jgi:hypothetical protein